MKINRLHLIAFDIPYPADYGGVIDVFHKIQALSAANVRVTVHCWQYGNRQPQLTLESVCEKVFYYPRREDPLSILKSFWQKKPFIVGSRQDAELLKNLLQDDAPILFEGLHTCDLIAHKALANRFKIVRMHNVEWEYYANLENLENTFWKKLYFKRESYWLKAFENQVITQADSILSISPSDQTYFQDFLEKKNLDKNKMLYVPPFHPNKFVESSRGRGEGVLFHGKLSVNDNEKVALFLIEKIFSRVNIPLSIAGKDPSEKLLKAAEKYENVKIFPNPSESEMNHLIHIAHINLLLSFQRSGMKLKLLNSLFRGRFCVANKQMVENTGLESLCMVAETPQEIASALESLMNVQFSSARINERIEILSAQFSNVENARAIVRLL